MVLPHPHSYWQPSLCHSLPRPQVGVLLTVCVVSADASNLNAVVNMAVPLTAHPLQEGVSPTLWPADTELQVIAGTTRIILTTQSALIQSVIHGSFEHVQASLLFEHAFPGPLLALSFIRNALVTSAKKCGPAAASIHTRLLNDEDYVKRIAPLVSTTI